MSEGDRLHRHQDEVHGSFVVGTTVTAVSIFVSGRGSNEKPPTSQVWKQICSWDKLHCEQYSLLVAIVLESANPKI